ncbi:MAG: hypothetical protein OEW56_02140 [Gemmatimonadota bacterium]|nr:hypothetical protein [Gemmatimonadota bacterium]
MRSTIFRLTPAMLMLCGTGTALAQGLPASQPGFITIYREYVKTGRAAEHATIEAGWPAAFATANSPTTYLALTSMTGGSEVWFLVPSASYAAMEADSKRNAANPALTAELDRLSRADAETLDQVRTMLLRARPDLSMGAFPNLAKVRYYEVTTFRVRLGQQQAFEAASKTWMASATRNNPSAAYRTYELVAGGPTPTYMVFTSSESYAAFDPMMAMGDKIWAGMTTDELAVMQNAVAGIANMQSDHFRVDATMSYVDKATKDQDPTFWLPKKVGEQ